ncbi:hypothetical protein ACQ4PT_054495 [Festuca glaucescens]
MDVRYELVSDVLPVGFDRSLHHDEFMGALLHAFSGNVEEVLRRVVVDPAATCLVTDTFFVWPGHTGQEARHRGHVIPVTHLALRLAARGFAVTVVNTEAVHDQTARALGVDPTGYNVFADARAWASPQTMDVRYELVSDVLPVGFDRSLHHDEFMGALLHAFSGNVEEVLRRVVVDPAATCLVTDTFFVWPGHTGQEARHRVQPRKDTITYIPGVPAIEPHELMPYLQETDTTSVVHRIIFKAFEEARGADYVLCNIVEELEPSTIAALCAEKPFYAVGPIFPAGFAHSALATSMWAESDCSSWLDAQPAGSVLYISFGSYAHVTKQELHKIAGAS